jgi:hypothetical protein
MLTDQGLTSLDPAQGRVLWEYPVTKGTAYLPIDQPQVTRGGQVLIQGEVGLALLQVTRQYGEWVTAQRWSSRGMKPSLNDYVIDGGHIYGFDDGIFCCLDLATGERTWKEGRYGHGQVLLIADQHLLLVVSERGAVILVTADPKRHQVLGRFQAIDGKTWNHPVLAHGRLYVRNGEEMACYELKRVEGAAGP